MPKMPCTLEIKDHDQLKVVTEDVLRKARAQTDIQITDYPSKTVDFTSTIKKTIKDNDLKRHDKICDSALDLIGKTPMIRLDRLAKKYDIECELVGKCEFLSIGGSVKDRIGKCMIEEAFDTGIIKRGDCLVEATSGNTGVGMALVSAIKECHMIITLPEKMSDEKLNTMRALGAEIVRTPTEAAWNDITSHIGLANQLQKTIPNCHLLDQYVNPANPRAHYFYTAEEILFQCDHNIDMVVATCGTGGTLTGIAKKIKECLPECQIVAVDPRGSSLAQPEELNTEGKGNSYLVEGIGYDFIPSTLDRRYIDQWIKTEDNESFRFARELMRLEGLLVGGSSGSAIAGALRVARNLKKGQRCVVVLPDSARNYITKFISDDWMITHGFYPMPSEPTSYHGTVDNISVTHDVCVEPREDLRTAMTLMHDKGLHHLPILLQGKVLVGVITLLAITKALLKKDISLSNNKVAEFMDKKFFKISPSTPLAHAARYLTSNDYVVVMEMDGISFRGILTRRELLSTLL